MSVQAILVAHLFPLTNPKKNWKDKVRVNLTHLHSDKLSSSRSPKKIYWTSDIGASSTGYDFWGHDMHLAKRVLVSLNVIRGGMLLWVFPATMFTDWIACMCLFWEEHIIPPANPPEIMLITPFKGAPWSWSRLPSLCLRHLL